MRDKKIAKDDLLNMKVQVYTHTRSTQLYTHLAFSTALTTAASRITAFPLAFPSFERHT